MHYVNAYNPSNRSVNADFMPLLPPAFLTEVAPFLKGMVQDSNASCLDVALDALLVFAGNYANASEHSSELAPGIVAKGLSGRPGTITRAEEVLTKLMEVILSALVLFFSTLVIDRSHFFT